MELSMIQRGLWAIIAVSGSEVALLAAVVCYGDRIRKWFRK